MPRLALRDGVTMHYETDGTGPPLVMIAGMCSDSASWAPLLPLVGGFRVIRPDNRATGRTVPWNAPLSVPVCAADILALLDDLNLAQAHVLGHSLGGLIALHLARTAPERVAGVTLLAAAPLRLARNVALFEALVAIRESDAPPDLWLRSFFPWLFAPEVYDRPGAIEAALTGAMHYPHAQSAEAMRHQLGALTGYDPPRGPVRPPVRAILGADDLILPEALARNALAGLGDVDVLTVPGAGHSVHWDAPQAVAAQLPEPGA
ncbi:MAG: alpha/beta hydrolase [Rhodobacteraceae bacterium]|nr:alpha/beta hydrolase [Paracoccaceae bacterium]